MMSFATPADILATVATILLIAGASALLLRVLLGEAASPEADLGSELEEARAEPASSASDVTPEEAEAGQPQEAAASLLEADEEG